MDVTTPEFAADLSELRIIGEMDLPTLGAIYAKANNTVAATADQDSAAFATLTRGGLSPIAAAWTDLRDYLQNIFGHTAENMYRAGVAVRHIVDTYAATDEAADEALRRTWRDGTPPGAIDGERMPTTPAPVVKIAGS